MEKIIKKLSCPRQTKSLLQNSDIDQFDHLLNLVTNLKQVKEDDVRIEVEQAKEQHQKQQELEAISEQIISNGVDFDKLVNLVNSKKKSSVTYVYGNNKTWDGVGDIPRDLQSLIDTRFELSDFIKQA